MNEIATSSDQLLGSLSQVTVLFTLALASSLLIERLLEILKAIYDLVDGRNDMYTRWTRTAHAVREYAEKKLRVFEYVEPEQASPILRRFSEMLLNDQQGYTGTVPMLSGDLVRALYVKSFSKLLSIAIGIVMAMNLRIDLVSIWVSNEPAHALLRYYWVLTGIAIGLGAGPMHKIITAIEWKREKRKKGDRS